MARQTPTLTNLAKRILSAAVLVPLVVGVYFIGGVLWGCFLAGLAGLMAYEWFRIVSNRQPALWAVFMSFLFGAVFVQSGLPAWAVLLSAAPALTTQSQNRVACFLAGPAIALPLLSLHVVGAISPLALLWLVLSVWATDGLAMLFGKTFGGPRLAPTISPHKTWAGLAGGITGGLMVTGVLIMTATLPTHFLLWAPGLSLLGQGGDLLESLLKRRFNVKDSGHIIPGHGGVLDRMDSFILTAPTLALALHLSLPSLH